MSDKNKNIKNKVTDFLRYHRNELSGKERNSFERELQKDPFTGEASEGFAPMSHEDVLKDISDLQKRIKARTVSRRRFLFYRIAASLALLMAIGTIYFYIGRNKLAQTLADNSVQSKQMEITASQPLKQPPATQEIQSEKKADYRISESASQQKRQVEAARNIATADNLQLDEAFKKDTTSELINYHANADYKIQQISAPVSILAGDSLSEVAVIGYGMKKDATGAVNPDEHTPPTPVTGKSNFDKYIRNNLHRPDSATSGQRVVVVVSFLVKADGRIDSISIIKSPGKSFSDEAIRIIKSGPQWKPAENKGKPVEDVVRLRLVFK